MDGPIFVDLARKKKGANWTTSVTVELVFKRKLAFNAYSFQFWQGEPKKVEEEKVEEEAAKKTENNKDAKVEEPAAEQEQEVEEQRPGNRAYMYVYVFNMANGKDRDQFEKLLVSDFNFYY